MGKKEVKDILDRWVETDLTAEAAAGRLGRAFGREELLVALEEVYLAGRSPVLVGEPGVGKTALVHELVLRAAAGLGQVRLDGARVLQLSLRRGASTIGRDEAVGRHFLELADALVACGSEVIVYLRDLQLASALDLEEQLTVLVGRLARPLIGEGEPALTRSLIECEPQLEAHCALFEIGEPSLDDTRRILGRWVEQAERRRPGLRVLPEAVETALQLSHRYLVRSRLPRKAMAPLEQLAATGAAGGGGARRAIGEGDVVALFCRQYGLPRSLVDPAEPLDLERVRRQLREQVLGQPQAVEVAAALLAHIKAGLLDPQRPLGVLLFVGPSGVGKTLLARRIAELALGSADRMIRVNMADYPGEDDGLLLFGKPNAYALPERQGLLTRRILGCQFGVLLLDELDKASPRVHDRFLQLIDEGSFVNGAGQQVPCRSLIVIATSNAGSGLWRDERAGFREDGASGAAGSRAAGARAGGVGGSARLGGRAWIRAPQRRALPATGRRAGSGLTAGGAAGARRGQARRRPRGRGGGRGPAGAPPQRRRRLPWRGGGASAVARGREEPQREHVVTPSPTARHQLLSRALFRALDAAATQAGLGEVLYAPLDVTLFPTDVARRGAVDGDPGNRNSRPRHRRFAARGTTL